MKSIDLFCSSPASTAICSSMGQRAVARPGMRPVSDTKNAPCSSHLPFDPSRRSYHKTRTNKSSKQTGILRRKSSADVDDLANPHISSRKYLLSDDQSFLDIIPDSKRAPVTTDMIRKYNNKRLELDSRKGLGSFSTRSYANDEYPIYKPSSTSSDYPNGPRKSLSALSNPQVVELRVSIHCKGCEGKLRKYISRMEGVTSFSIDLATKKVTVIGNVTPLGVLTSISKVKNAQLWPSPTSSSSSSSSPRDSLSLSLAR